MNHRNHLVMMVLPFVAIAGILLALGRPLVEALLTAAILSCPLHMVMMMFGGHGGHALGSTDGQDRIPGAAEVPLDDRLPATGGGSLPRRSGHGEHVAE